jgi:amino acid transporter
MRNGVVSALVALCLVSVLALASVVSADEHAILSGDSYSVEASLSLAETLDYSWTCDVLLDFVVEDPTGGVYTYVTDEDSWSAFIIAFISGTYTLTWYNNATTVAHLDFTLSDSFGEVEEGLSMMVWAAIIAGIVILAVVVIVVIVVVMGGRNAPAQPVMGPQPQMTAQAVATGHCPTCGNQIDPNASFCAKCGTRYR